MIGAAAYTVSLMLTAALAMLSLTSVSGADTVVVNTLIDEFDGPGPAPDPTKWFAPGDKEPAIVSDGKLRCAASAGRRCELQSIDTVDHALVQILVKSSHWKDQTSVTDSSLGLENFIGTCHYGVVFKANGHLDVLRSFPDGNGNCTGDPQQVSLKIKNWEAVRAASTVLVTFVFAPGSVVLAVSSVGPGGPVTGVAHYRGNLQPEVPLRVRLNVDCAIRFPGDTQCSSVANEVYKVKYVRAVQIPW